jgi:hypothetical protein
MIFGVKTALDQAITIAHFIIPAYSGPPFIDSAKHGPPIKRRTPAIIEATHHFAAPVIHFRQASRGIIVAHQHHFKAATASLAVITGNRLGIG